ncbi:MAG: hypothetical protein KGL39_52065 [Patescibacteria group bacterium]|nr:hypothetical protein [Patescibacteria group bacterium]
MEDSKKATPEYTIPPASKFIDRLKKADEEFHVAIMKKITKVIEKEMMMRPENGIGHFTWFSSDSWISAIGKRHCERIRSELKTAGYSTKFFIGDGNVYGTDIFIVCVSIGDYTYIKLRSKGKEIYPEESPPAET